MSEQRYVPRPDGIYARFHAACIESKAVCVQHCVGCGRYQHPPRWLCGSCGSACLDFVAQPGRAICASAVVTHRATSPGWPTPYVTVLAELPVGPRLIAAWESGDQPPASGTALNITVRTLEERFAFFVAAASSSIKEPHDV